MITTQNAHGLFWGRCTNVVTLNQAGKHSAPHKRCRETERVRRVLGKGRLLQLRVKEQCGEETRTRKASWRKWHFSRSLKA